jgi:DMSO/TMAO reductase YedYZ molybdopterin-dependent catalytic subunit
MTDWVKFIEAKIKLAKKGASPSPVSEEERIPNGQHRVTNFPVLDLGIHPKVSREEWRLKLFGLVGKEVELDWEQLSALPQIKDTSDFHCVTRWSQLDMEWEGVLARDVVALCEPLPDARFVTLHGYDNYTTNLPLEALLDDDVIIAHSVFGKPLTLEHGGPVRLVVPKRYGWKSAKWLKAIEFHQKDRPGFWEVRGYHNHADPWLEERFGWPVRDEE